MHASIPSSALPDSPATRLDWLRLIRSRRVGPTTFIRLLRQFGSAAAALDALPDIAAEAGETRYRTAAIDAARAEIDRSRAIGATMLCLGTPPYPARLAELPDAPPILWALGDTGLLDRPVIAMVGARNASAVGKRMAARLAGELGELGYAIVSGLARGIDASAHEAALPTGTIAVQAGGIDVIYPRENADLTLKIAEQGLRLSEMPPGLAPQARHFPARNRIISGLSDAVVVVEGAARSGSLITARNALDQGREVMAVPGSPLDARAAGCNMLIRDGAELVRSAQDVHDSLQRPAEVMAAPELPLPEPEPAPRVATAGLPGQILGLLSPTPMSEDLIIRTSGAEPTTVMAILAELDVSGQIERQPGGLVSLAS